MIPLSYPDIARTLSELFFPLQCALCNAKTGRALCEPCGTSIPRERFWRDDTVSFFSHSQSRIRDLIHAVKYEGYKPVGRELGHLVAEELSETFFEEGIFTDSQAEPLLLIPIPLSRERLRTRGWNQAEQIARGIEETDPLSYKTATHILFKIRDTESQVRVHDREHRLANIQGSFEVRSPESINKKLVIVVDDVTTTGTTIAEARKVLLQAGAQKVVGVTVAH